MSLLHTADSSQRESTEYSLTLELDFHSRRPESPSLFKELLKSWLLRLPRLYQRPSPLVRIDLKPFEPRSDPKIDLSSKTALETQVPLQESLRTNISDPIRTVGQRIHICGFRNIHKCPVHQRSDIFQAFLAVIGSERCYLAHFEDLPYRSALSSPFRLQ